MHCQWCCVFTLHISNHVQRLVYNAVSNPQDCSKHFTFHSLADLFNWTPSQVLWEAFSHAAINLQRLLMYIYPPLSIAKYSFIQLSGLEQCRVKKLAQGFTRQHKIKTWVLLAENPMFYRWATTCILFIAKGKLWININKVVLYYCVDISVVICCCNNIIVAVCCYLYTNVVILLFQHWCCMLLW